MQREPSRHKPFARRAMILGGGKLALVSVLVGRLYDLQVVEADRHRTLADENRINLRLLPPSRGRIRDRSGQPLAVNRPSYRVVIVPEQARDVDASLKALAALVPLTDRALQAVLRKVRSTPGFVPVAIRDKLTWEEVARVEVNAADLPGISIEFGQTRHYPSGPVAAHVIGHLGAAEADQAAEAPLLQLPGFRIGKTGVEKHYDLALRGRAGTRQLEVDARGRMIRELSRQDAEPGSDVTLALDIGQQRLVSARLEPEQSAAAVVLNAHSGEVLAMASAPSFDANLLSEGIDDAAWRELTGRPGAPLINKTVAGQFAPGSTFKMMVALAALENAIAVPSHRAFCPGYFDLGNARFHCWKRTGHGWLEMEAAVEQSCDVYFYELGLRTGIDRVAEMARRFGLGQESGVDIPGEASGFVPTPDWKLATTGTPWQKGETVITAIGQGFLLATPLQLAVMTAGLVNGGYKITPRLARKAPARDDIHAEPAPVSLGVSPTSLAVMRAAMHRVTNSRRGTAYRARIAESAWAMGGKTGTSQVRRITARERLQGVRTNDELPWGARDHALFVGYAPVSAPRYAVAVVVEHGGSGSAAAAPIARDVLIEAQRREPSSEVSGEQQAVGRDGRVPSPPKLTDT